MNYTFQQALVFLLRGSNITGITWGSTATLDSTGSPYFQEIPEPLSKFPFPYVILLIPDSTVAWTQNQYGIETYTPEVHVVGYEADVVRLGSPNSDESVLSFLDALSDAPQVLCGNRFECCGWMRKDWRLDRDSTKERAPDGQRVWVASAKYEALVTIQQILWRGGQ